ncbi:MAG: GNAT family N-acetyltransferase [Lachnospirales bacterium]
MVIQSEEEKDCEEIYDVVKIAFSTAEHTDGNEQDLVIDLRRSEAYIPELSLIAEVDGDIVGHIMFTKAIIGDNEVLALAPLSVLPKHQRQGIGAKLISEGHRITIELGYNYSVVVGSEVYYPKFGYIPAYKFGIDDLNGVPKENLIAIKLKNKAKKLCGRIIYSKEFGI